MDLDLGVIDLFYIIPHIFNPLCHYDCDFFSGFVEKEIKKANIPITDTGENPEVPFPRDMIDLEVNAPYKVLHVDNAKLIFLQRELYKCIIINMPPHGINIS